MIVNVCASSRNSRDLYYITNYQYLDSVQTSVKKDPVPAVEPKKTAEKKTEKKPKKKNTRSILDKIRSLIANKCK